MIYFEVVVTMPLIINMVNIIIIVVTAIIIIIIIIIIMAILPLFNVSLFTTCFKATQTL